METTKVTAERIKEYLESGKRFDGRKPDEFREISIETGVSKNAEGSVRVKIGKTDVIAGVKMEVSEPYPDSPDNGNLVVSAELLPMSSSRYEAGPPKIEAIELARVTDRIVRESKFIDMEELCITKGEKVWTVYIDIYSINADGNLLDAAGLAAIAALRIAKMPKYDKKEEKIIRGEFTDKNIPLKKETPISIVIDIGVSFFKGMFLSVNSPRIIFSSFLSYFGIFAILNAAIAANPAASSRFPSAFME